MRQLFFFCALTIWIFSPCPAYAQVASAGTPGGCEGTAEALYLAGDFAEVIEQIEAPSTASEWMCLADALHKLEQFEEAEKAYLEAGAAGYDGPELLLHRAICRVSLGATEAATDDLIAAYNLLPEEARIPYYLAALAYASEDSKRGLAYLEDALTLDPNYYDAHYLKGAFFYELGKGKQASAAFERCLELRPEDERARLNMAMSEAAQLSFASSREQLDDLLLFTEDEEILRDAYYQRGALRYETRDFSGACEDWANAADLGDRDAEQHLLELCGDRKKKLKQRKGVYVEF